MYFLFVILCIIVILFIIVCIYARGSSSHRYKRGGAENTRADIIARKAIFLCYLSYFSIINRGDRPRCSSAAGEIRFLPTESAAVSSRRGEAERRCLDDAEGITGGTRVTLARAAAPR